MEPFSQTCSFRWSDLDPVGHVRHSVYYDFCAQLRTKALAHYGISLQTMQQHGMGPVLFEEKAVFKREMHFGDIISLNLQAKGFRTDFNRFAFIHHFERADGTLCATVEVLGAWMDLRARKLGALPKYGPPPGMKYPGPKGLTGIYKSLTAGLIFNLPVRPVKTAPFPALLLLEPLHRQCLLYCRTKTKCCSLPLPTVFCAPSIAWLKPFLL